MKIGHTIAKAKEIYARDIRAAAQKARDAVVTPGKESTYAEKKRQAKVGSGPYIDAEARRSGLTAKQAAKKIADAADLADGRLTAIDIIELDRLQDLENATSITTAATVVRRAVEELK